MKRKSIEPRLGNKIEPFNPEGVSVDRLTGYATSWLSESGVVTDSLLNTLTVYSYLPDKGIKHVEINLFKGIKHIEFTMFLSFWTIIRKKKCQNIVKFVSDMCYNIAGKDWNYNIKFRLMRKKYGKPSGQEVDKNYSDT